MGKSTKRKPKKNVVRGIVHIKATFNNTQITITDMNGDTVSWGAAGAVGFKGTRKSTPYAAQRAADHAAHQAVGRSASRQTASSNRLAKKAGYSLVSLSAFFSLWV